MLFLFEDILGASNTVDRKKSHVETINTFIELYEAEIFQESYLPAFQRELTEKLRKKRVDTEESLKKVTAMEEED